MRYKQAIQRREDVYGGGVERDTTVNRSVATLNMAYTRQPKAESDSVVN
jgi:hypothetical protein